MCGVWLKTPFDQRSNKQSMRDPIEPIYIYGHGVHFEMAVEGLSTKKNEQNESEKRMNHNEKKKIQREPRDTHTTSINFVNVLVSLTF